MIPYVVAGLYLLLAVLVGVSGRRRRMGFLGSFILSLLLTPVLGVLLLYLTQESPGRAAPSDPPLRSTR